jgi:hypothetical protein
VSDQGLTFAAYIARELETEQDRRRTLDARGASVVTVSGGLATLLVAVGALVSGRAGVELPESTAWPLTLTLLAFATAALCGIVATFQWRYDVANTETLEAMLTDRWPTTEIHARNYAARLDVNTITSLRKGNSWKTRFLIAALVFQVVGLGALTYAVYRILQAAS